MRACVALRVALTRRRPLSRARRAQLRVGLWSGVVRLENVDLRLEARARARVPSRCRRRRRATPAAPPPLAPLARAAAALAAAHIARPFASRTAWHAPALLRAHTPRAPRRE
jgi:hypothetical protein